MCPAGENGLTREYDFAPDFFFNGLDINMDESVRRTSLSLYITLTAPSSV